MTRLLSTSESKLKGEYFSVRHAIMKIHEKAKFTPINEFEQTQLNQLETNLKRIKTKLILKGIQV